MNSDVDGSPSTDDDAAAASDQGPAAAASPADDGGGGGGGVDSSSRSVQIGTDDDDENDGHASDSVIDEDGDDILSLLFGVRRTLPARTSSSGTTNNNGSGEGNGDDDESVRRAASLVQSFLDAHEEWTSLESELRRLEGGGDDGPKEDDATKGNAKEEVAPHSTLSAEELAEHLFQPGMKFRGRIFVPGMSGASDENEDDDDQEERGKPYELVVVERGHDELGHDYIFARHAAYGDEQCVNLRVLIEDGDTNRQDEQQCTEEGEGSNRATERLRVEYADGETCCVGHWNPAARRIEGHVRQRLRANDGIFHTSDEVTHVFTLHPCTGAWPGGAVAPILGPAMSAFDRDIRSDETKALVGQRDRRHQALQRCFKTFTVMFQAIKMRSDDIRALLIMRGFAGMGRQGAAPSLTPRQALLWKLRDVRWTDLLHEACTVGAEGLCAEFRFRASLLDAMAFATPQDRADAVARWKGAGMDRSSAHARWDAREFRIRALSQMAYVHGGAEDGGRSNGSKLLYLRFQARQRLHASFECFEGAYRRAEARLAKEELARYEIRAERQAVLGNGLCIICQSGLRDSDEGALEEGTGRLYELPCTHLFHERCVGQWLHDHSSCPVCRYDLKESSLQDGKEG